MQYPNCCDYHRVGGDRALSCANDDGKKQPRKNPVLRTAEDRQLMADAMFDAMAEAIQPYTPGFLPPPLVAIGLSMVAVMRVEHPEVTQDEAIKAAATTIGARYFPAAPTPSTKRS